MKAAEYVHLTERLAILRRDDRGGVFHLRAKLKGRDGYVYRTTNKRAGSGNLNRWDKWIFRAIAA